MRKLVLLFGLTALVGFVASCGGDDEGSINSGSEQNEPTTAETSGPTTTTAAGPQSLSDVLERDDLTVFASMWDSYGDAAMDELSDVGGNYSFIGLFIPNDDAFEQLENDNPEEFCYLQKYAADRFILRSIYHAESPILEDGTGVFVGDRAGTGSIAIEDGRLSWKSHVIAEPNIETTDGSYVQIMESVSTGGFTPEEGSDNYELLENCVNGDRE